MRAIRAIMVRVRANNPNHNSPHDNLWVLESPRHIGQRSCFNLFNFYTEVEIHFSCVYFKNNDLWLADILAFRRNTENDGKKSNHFQLSKQVLGTERFPRTAKINCTAHALSEKFPFPFRSVTTFPLSK